MADDYTIRVGDTAIEATSVVNSVAVYNVLVDVIRDTKVNSSEGIAVTPETLHASVPCHIKWKGGEKLLFKKQSHYVDAILSCRKPAGVTITCTDRIFYNEKYYEIVDINDVNNLGRLLQIAIKRVK